MTARLDFGDEAQSAAGGQPAAGCGIVLLVEDDVYVRDATTLILNELGYSVVAAERAETALEFLSGGAPIDFLFSDHLLPGVIDGASLIAQARRSRPDLPALLTSGYSGAAAEAARSLSGAPVRILEKPFRRTQLADAIAQALAETTTTATRRSAAVSGL